MTDPIRLSREERAAAIEAMVAAYDTGKSLIGLLDKAVDAANKVRVGDAVGTLRRNPNGVVYERHELNGRRYWEPLATWPTFGSPRTINPDPEGISSWRVLYIPEES